MSIKSPPPAPPVLKKSEKVEKLELRKMPDEEKIRPILHRMKEILVAEPGRPNVGPLPSILHEAGYKTDMTNNGVMAGENDVI